MAAQDRDVLINELKLEAIANALREKTGVSTNTYTMSQVPGAIDALSLTSSGGSATTAAVAANVLAGKSYINASTGASETGTMTDKSGTSQSAGSTAADGNLIKMQIPSGGYYSSTSYLTTGKSTFGNAATTEVLDGKTFTSTAGLNTLGSMSNLGGTTRIVTPTFGDGSVLLGIPVDGYYNTSSILAAEGSEFGDASASDVLSGKTFTSAAGIQVTGTFTAQTKTQAAGTSNIIVTPDSGKYLTSVTVTPTPTEEKTVSSSASDQVVTPSSGKYLSKVTINAMSTPSITTLAYYPNENKGTTRTLTTDRKYRIIVAANYGSVKTWPTGTYTEISDSSIRIYRDLAAGSKFEAKPNPGYSN